MPALDVAAIARELADDALSPRATQSLRRRGQPLAAPREQLQRLAALPLADAEGPAQFRATIARHGWQPLAPAALEIFQVNLGKLCNMTCRHCHVDAGPDRTDAMMDDATFADVLRALDRSGAHTVDVTGGAPELHPRFRDLVVAATAAGKHVLDRCNLTVLTLPRSDDLPAFLGAHGVEVVASLPHVRARNTDAQRGAGTFARSLDALRRLNAAGYGQGDLRRRLTLVSNPAGAFLAPPQAATEREWRQALEREHGVTFDRLIALNNMPIARFLEWLEDSGNLESYMQRLVAAFNPAAVAGVMCRNTISVAWDGTLYDCDFNQMLELPAAVAGARPHVRDFSLDTWQARAIVTARHCYGCTAGAGSSCGGQVA